MPLRLVIANKAYSSWSMRPWLLLAHLNIPFEEIVVPLDLPTTRRALLRHAPTARAPALRDGDIVVWDSLAIIEYIAEKYPKKQVWPAARAARAMARSMSAEMHSGFQALRTECPMNFRRAAAVHALSPQALDDVARIERAWAGARRAHGTRGPFLFGKFSAADAMFAPVVNRLDVYGVKVSKATRAYMATIMALPAWGAWAKDAAAESWHIDRYDNG